MLFTRCPGCRTTFRITADTLRVANGAVRCGSCATVFSAFSGLQQSALDDGLQTDEEFLSPTMQTQELARIEEIASPDISVAPDSAAELEDGAEAVATGPQFQDADQELAGRSAQPEIEAVAQIAPVLDARAQVDGAPAQDDLTSDVLLELDEDAASEASSLERQPEHEDRDEDVASESPEKLQFDAPADEWALLLSEIEKSTDADTDEAPSSESDETDPDSVDFWDVGESAATEPWTEIELEGDEDTANELIAVGAPEVALDLDEPLDPPAGTADIDADVAALFGAEPDISEEQVDATLSAATDPDLIAELEAGLPAQRAAGQRLRPWAVGSALLTLALVLQVIHHFRAPLADQSLIGSLVQNAYGVFGAELVPQWDLEQYEILNWVATEADAGNLRIAAQIRNNGPRAQPYPHIHLELKDRWEAVVGSRVFEPVEYLQADAASGDLMVAGVTIPADLTVVDPGEDAYGFELDVCAPSGAGLLTCTSERVFE